MFLNHGTSIAKISIGQRIISQIIGDMGDNLVPGIIVRVFFEKMNDNMEQVTTETWQCREGLLRNIYVLKRKKGYVWSYLHAFVTINCQLIGDRCSTIIIAVISQISNYCELIAFNSELSEL